MDIRPVTLEGDHVRLEPLTLGHHADLCAVGLDAELWRWTTALMYYSILESEWPEVKRGLEQKLGLSR